MPVAGKTGTTNGYRNAAFAGFVPKASETGWHWAEGYTIVSYVGNDDNTPMRRRSVRLQGSNGALPAWLGTAQAMADAGLLGVPPVNEPEWTVPEGYQQVPVAEGTGLPLAVAPEEPGRTVLVEGQGAPVRRFAPVGLAEPTSAALMRIGPARSDGSSGIPVSRRRDMDDGMRLIVPIAPRVVLDFLRSSPVRRDCASPYCGRGGKPAARRLQRGEGSGEAHLIGDGERGPSGSTRGGLGALSAREDPAAVRPARGSSVPRATGGDRASRCRCGHRGARKSG